MYARVVRPRTTKFGSVTIGKGRVSRRSGMPIPMVSLKKHCMCIILCTWSETQDNSL